MKTKHVFAFRLLYLLSVVTILFGVVDLLTPRVLPYHEEFLGLTHEQIDPKFSSLLLSALKIIGILLIALGILLGLLVRIPLARQEMWAWWTVLLTWSIVLASLLIVMLRIGLFTPWWVVAGMLAALLVVLILTVDMVYPPQ